MNSSDKICKEVFDLFSFVKEQAVKSVVQESSNERISLTEKDLEHLVNVLNSTFDTSFQRGFIKLQKQADSLISELNEATKKKK